MPKLLTVRKQKWVNNFKPNILRGDAFAPNMAVAVRYHEKLESLIRRMTNDVEHVLKRLYSGEAAQEYFEDAEYSQDASTPSIASQARILTNALKQKYDKLFAGQSQSIAESFAYQSDAASSKSVHMSIKKLSGGLSLSTKDLDGPLVEIIKATVAENVSLIKSIPQQYLQGVQQAVMRSIIGGTGEPDLVKYLQKHKGITYGRAKTIALDQTRKSFQGMSNERVKRLGVKSFEWRHVPSNRPRHEHELMDKKIYSYADPPVIDSKTGERGLPAQLINCRCQALPVIDFGE